MVKQRLDDFNIFRILSIDSSTKNIGIAVFDVAINKNRFNKEFEVVDLTTTNIRPRKLADVRGYPRHFDDLALMADIVKSRFTELLELTEPNLVVYEKAFANPRRPGAYGPLNAMVTTITQSVLDFDREIPVLYASPSQVKNALGQKGNCKKEVMFEAAIRHPVVLKFIDPTKITEDEIDAIAVGFYGLGHFKEHWMLYL